MAGFEKFNFVPEQESGENKEGEVEDPQRFDSVEKTEEAPSITEAEMEVLKDVLADEVAVMVEQEGREHMDADGGDIKDENIDDKKTQRRYIEGVGVSSLVEMLPERVKRVLQALTIASVFSGGISVAMAPQQAEAAENPYTFEAQQKTYRQEYKKERERIRRNIQYRKKAEKRAAQQRTKYSVERHERDAEYLHREIKYDARHDARYRHRYNDNDLFDVLGRIFAGKQVSSEQNNQTQDGDTQE